MPFSQQPNLWSASQQALLGLQQASCASQQSLAAFSVTAPVKRAVTLAEIKAEPKFKDFGLVRQSRLSVVPVNDEHWKLIEKMASAK